MHETENRDEKMLTARVHSSSNVFNVNNRCAAEIPCVYEMGTTVFRRRCHRWYSSFALMVLHITWLTKEIQAEVTVRVDGSKPGFCRRGAVVDGKFVNGKTKSHQ